MGVSILRTYDVIIIGGGIVGLSTAMKMSSEYPNLDIAVIEKEDGFAEHQTGHNSGVIHAGIYYKPGSKKGSFCYAGNKELRKYCDIKGIEYDLCGKLIVATDIKELEMLKDLHSRGVANGVDGLKMIDKNEIKDIEPHASGLGALHSPNTGIVDYKLVAKAYAEDAEQQGVDLFTSCKFLGYKFQNGKTYLNTTDGDFETEWTINCAGLYADKIANKMDVYSDTRIIPFRGEFFSIIPEKSSMIKGLIYPVPQPELPFLGVHFTKRVDGTIEAGPNAVLAFAREGYKKTDFSIADLFGYLRFPGFWRMSATHWKTGIDEQYRSLFKKVFAKSLQKLVPDIKEEDLSNPSAGVRAQAVSFKGEIVQDFKILSGPKSIHVLNAPSPAATASLIIGEEIVQNAKSNFDI